MRVVVGLSGGVDSAVSAYLLKRFCRTSRDVAALLAAPTLLSGPAGSACRSRLMEIVANGTNQATMCTLIGDSSSVELRNGNEQIEVIAAHMQNWQNDLESENDAVCFSRDVRDSERVVAALQLGSLHRVDFSAEYWTQCFEPMIAAFEKGGTLNVDMLCNRHIKYGHFLDHCRRHLDATYLATGHYARTVNMAGGSMSLMRPEERVWRSLNDQSYFLAFVEPRALQLGLFPLGQLGLTKAEVREIASSAPELRDLGIAKKPTSTGLCFVNSPTAKQRFPSFVGEYVTDAVQPTGAECTTTGANVTLMDSSGRVLGKTLSLSRHLLDDALRPLPFALTLGQKVALRDNTSNALEKWYVAKKNITAVSRIESLIVCPTHNDPVLFSSSLIVSVVVVHEDNVASWPRMSLFVALRHQHTPVGCAVELVESKTVLVRLLSPVRCVTPGQAAVFYRQAPELNSLIVVGGGWIVTE